MRGSISEAVKAKIRLSQNHAMQMVGKGNTLYGITTGFDILANTRISEEDTCILQYKIFQSHSVGIGDSIPAELNS